MKPKIALIDSNKTQIKVLKELLLLANYEVLCVTKSDSLLSLINYNPNLILFNLNINEIEDGLQLFEKCNLHLKLKTIPFIIIAKNAHRTLIRKLMDLGVDDVITNPSNKIEILKIIKSRLSRVQDFESLNKKNYLYQSPNNLLNSKIIQEILSKKKLYHFKSNEPIYCSGNKSNHIFLIKKGTVKTFITNDLGKEFITEYFTTDEYFGYTSFIKNKPHFENAKALSSTYLYKISREEIISQIQKNNFILFNFIEVLADDLVKLRDKLILLAYGSVRKKTAVTLINLQKYYPLKNDAAINIKRKDLADFIGIAKETLTRTLHDFKNEKLIQLSTKSITILNKNKLNKVT